jgi:protein-S-isoprenylcysteine O-methyltransferase Ste14
MSLISVEHHNAVMPTSMRSLYSRGILSTLIGAIVMMACLFLPAGTLNYWQAWVFFAVFEIASQAIGIYLAVHDPKLLERRMKFGPAAEKETSQRIIMALVIIGFLAMLVVPAFDHRFGWSPVPPFVSIAGDAFIALSFLFFFFVLKENSYAASTIQIAEGQKVVSTGPYAHVRHPMYAGAIVMLIGIPLALGSWWGLFLLIPFTSVLVWRLVDEEKFLHKNLPGYTEYAQNVRCRLVPHIW